MTMNKAFRPLLDKCVIVYLDDILIYSPDREQLQDIEAVFKILSENRLLTKASECEFLQDRLEFLGHIISAEGVEIDPKKMSTIQAWHALTNLTELHSFLGSVNYVRRFVPDMAKLTAPLTNLLRKGVEYTLGEKEQAAFSALKQILCSPPVLHIADPHRPFELFTDASDIAVGALLLQDFGNGLQPIAYESRKLHPPERNYPIHDREMLAIVHAFKVWRCYLTGADVTVRTDHRSLQYLRAQPNLNPRQICCWGSGTGVAGVRPSSSRPSTSPLFPPLLLLQQCGGEGEGEGEEMEGVTRQSQPASSLSLLPLLWLGGRG
ncbi:unnamed protein product [Closterium sp. NIES-54]